MKTVGEKEIPKKMQSWPLKWTDHKINQNEMCSGASGVV